jgi:hypothetical protein
MCVCGRYGFDLLYGTRVIFKPDTDTFSNGKYGLNATVMLPVVVSFLTIPPPFNMKLFHQVV